MSIRRIAKAFLLGGALGSAQLFSLNVPSSSEAQSYHTSGQLLPCVSGLENDHEHVSVPDVQVRPWLLAQPTCHQFQLGRLQQTLKAIPCFMFGQLPLNGLFLP